MGEEVWRARLEKKGKMGFMKSQQMKKGMEIMKGQRMKDQRGKGERVTGQRTKGKDRMDMPAH